MTRVMERVVERVRAWGSTTPYTVSRQEAPAALMFICLPTSLCGLYFEGALRTVLLQNRGNTNRSKLHMTLSALNETLIAVELQGPLGRQGWDHCR